MHVSPTRDVLELFNTFVHDLVGFSDISLKQLRINGRQRVTEPAFTPTQPIRRGGPQISIRLEVFYKLLQTVVLSSTFTPTTNSYSLAFEALWNYLITQEFFNMIQSVSLTFVRGIPNKRSLLL